MKPYRVWIKDEYEKAGPTDLVMLKAPPGANPLIFMKKTVETLVYAICSNEACHVSGPTGSGKTALIDAVTLVPDNFTPICEVLEFPIKAVKCYPIEMSTYETPGELIQRRALKNGKTYDEPSRLVKCLEDAEREAEKQYSVIWLREMGRVHTASVQSGLFNLMSSSRITLPWGKSLNGNQIGWLADSNYQALQDAAHTLVLVVLDAGLKRRLSFNLTVDYLDPGQEATVLEQLVQFERLKTVNEELIHQVIKLGQEIRRSQEEGNLQSVAPPTISSYLAVLRMLNRMPHWSMQQVIDVTLLGNASQEDEKTIPGIYTKVFGLQYDDEEDLVMGGNLF